MSSAPPLVVNVREFIKALRTFWIWWVAPTACLTLIALGYALVKQNVWQATQVLHVRNEAAGVSDGPGKFLSIDAMKTSQETLLELARNQNALANALREVGPPANRRSGATWPSAEDIDAVREAITIKAPGGAEFGSTEVLHVSVEAATPERAVALTAAVCDELEKNLRELRHRRTASVIAELTKSLQLAQIDLAAATRKLEDLESEIGGDLPEVRLLNQSGTGDSNLRTSINQIKNELRSAKAAHEDKQEQLKYLIAARDDASQVIAMPNRLLESQPALKLLKDGLVAAQLRRAELAGTVNEQHPKMQAAIAAEKEVREKLRQEVDVAIRGLEADIAISKTLIGSLEKQRIEVERRLQRIAGLRASYSNLEAEVKQRSEIVQHATKGLADARASHASAKGASLITRIDRPQLGTYPLGPGRATICIAGLFGGLATGFGLVFLVSPVGQAAGRRWSDSVVTLGRRASDLIPGIGRRKSDVPGGRRNGDPPVSPAPALTAERRAGQERRST